MRYLGILLSALILTMTGLLVWQDGWADDTLVIRPAASDAVHANRPV